MSKQHKVELARTLCTSGSPLNKSQLARLLGIARSSLYVQLTRPKQDKALAVRIEAAHQRDDTMGHRKLAALLGTGKNRVKRVIHKYGIANYPLSKEAVPRDANARSTSIQARLLSLLPTSCATAPI